MLTVKDLFENEELMKNIVEDIDDVPEDTEVSYAVWALIYDKDDDCVSSFLTEEFADPDAAISYADNFSLEEFQRETPGMPPLYDFARITLEVETVICDPDDEDGGTMNIGTVYYKDVWTGDDYVAEEDEPI